MNKSLGKRIKEIRLIMLGSNKEVLSKKFFELSLLFNKTDREHLDNNVIHEMNLLKHEISMHHIKLLREKIQKQDYEV